MGWDAYSMPFNGCKEPDPQWKEVVEELDDCDGLLQYGGLDVSTCGRMLSIATSVSVYGPNWSVEEVRSLAAKANWDFSVAPQDEWANVSAKAFLNRCAELGKSIEFSW